jgi:hypothetical protein
MLPMWVNSASIVEQRADYRVRGRARSVGAFWFTSRSRAELAMRGAAISFLTRERTSLYGSFFAFFLAMDHDVIKTKAMQFNAEQGVYKTEVARYPIRRRRILRRRLAKQADDEPGYRGYRFPPEIIRITSRSD